ncbi:MAG: hypothetical protein ACREJD_11625 [Phycisphaerales bacterium]
MVHSPSFQQLSGPNSEAGTRDSQSGRSFGYLPQEKFDLNQFGEPEFDGASRNALARQGYLLFSGGPDRAIDFKGDGKVFVFCDEVGWNSIPSGADILFTPMPYHRR